MDRVEALVIALKSDKRQASPKETARLVMWTLGRTARVVRGDEDAWEDIQYVNRRGNI